MESFIAVDYASALATMGELAQLKEVHKVVPKFNKAVYESAGAVEGEEVLTVRPEDQGRTNY